MRFFGGLTKRGMGPKKREAWGPKKNIKKGAILQNKMCLMVGQYYREIFFVGVISGNINPPGGTGDKSRVFGNPGFGKKSRFENSSVDHFLGFSSSWCKVPIQWH